MFLRSGLLSSFAGLFIWVKNKRSCYVVVVGSHPRRFLSEICRFVREQSRQKQIPEPCGPPKPSGMTLPVVVISERCNRESVVRRCRHPGKS